MEFLIALRRIARHKLLCALGAVMALFVGAVAGGLLRPQPAAGSLIGYAASVKLLVDTARSQVADATTDIGSSTVIQRSVLLGDLAGSPPSTARIAVGAGIAQRDVSVAVPPFDPVMVSTYLPDGELPVRAAQVTRGAVITPYVVTVVANYSVPILTVSAAGPDGRGTVALLHSAVAELSALGTSGHRPPATPAAGARPAAAQSALSAPPLGVRVVQLGMVENRAIRSPSAVSRAGALAAAIVAFAAWCLAIVLAHSAPRGLPGCALGVRR